MRRADPPLADAEGAAVATYADSDVGSSPRSLSAGGGRPGSLTEEPPPALRWDDAAFARVKLMCSYGGRILPRPHDNQLRYVGGESRIAVVSRGITLSELTAKLSRMFNTSVVIKYQLPYEDLDALISVTSDEDLENMMEEYDRLQGAGNRPSARLRLFLFPLKLERSQTASLSDLMAGNNHHSHDGWFVDILNGFHVLPHVRSETSSIVSETQDYFLQGNTDSLEEWAAATSYGNSVVPPHTEQSPGNKQENPVSAAALFGSLLQHTGSNEVSSAPGSPLPLKHKLFTTGSSSSAPPAVISILSAMAEAASKGLPTPTQHVTPAIDGSAAGTYTGKTRLGSGDSSVGVPEQRKHVDGEVLLTSDKGILSSSAGGVDQLLPSGLMDDDDASQKLSAKGSFDEVRGNPQNIIFDAGVAEPSKALRGERALESPALMGQPIFDEEVLPVRVQAQNLNVLQLDESVSPPIVSPSGMSSASAQGSPTVLPPQQQISVIGVPKVSADDKLKQQVFPVSPRAGMRMSSEEKMMQQILPSSAPHVMVAKPDVEDVLRQVSPTLAHFLPPISTPQQVTAMPNVVGEETVRQIPGINVTKDAEMTIKPQPPPVTSGAPVVLSPSLLPSTLQQPVTQKVPAAPSPNYLYQGPALEVPMSVTTYATQAPVQLPVMSQVPSGVAANPLPPIAAPLKVANAAVAARPPAAGTSRPQSPHSVLPGGVVHPVPQMPQARNPPITTPPITPNNIEIIKGLTPVATNTGPTTVFSSMGEGVRGIPSTVYAQGEGVNMQRQVSDPLPSHRMAAVGPQPGNQFNIPNLGTPPAPGIPSRFRAVGRPVQPVAEGIPIQQAPIAGVISDKKAPVASQRTLTSPSTRPPLAPAGQYSYFMADQSNVISHPAALGGTARSNAPANVMLGIATSSSDPLPFSGANPFAESFQPISTYQDVLEVSPADQQQRRQMRP